MSKERLVELLKGDLPHFSNELKFWHDEHIGEIADYLLANGVIVPLLQTGQIVYRVSKGMMWEVKIWKIEICGKTISYIDNYDKSFLATHIGKGVFLTREEAEAKLKESDGK